MKKFRELSEAEKKLICNGCGGKGGWVKPPHGGLFKDECDHHDYNYYLGGTRRARKKADGQLYVAMRERVKTFSGLKYFRLLTWCYLYYIGVRTCGWKYFNYQG